MPAPPSFGLRDSLEDRKPWQGKAVGMALGKLVAREDAIWDMSGIFRHSVGLLQSGLSQVLALLATKLHGATQMSWLWELKHTSCLFPATSSMPEHRSWLDPMTQPKNLRF